MTLGKLFQQKRYVLFDMDGTLLDTNQLKVDAMRQALPEMNDADSFLTHFQQNFGWSRDKHFNYLRDEYLGGCATSTSRCRNRYEEYLDGHKHNIQFCVGAEAILAVLEQNDIGMSVVTGAAQQDARRLLKAKQKDDLMDEILGSPNIKADSVANIIEQFGLARKECVLIGDSMNDLKAAKANDIDFVYVEKYTLGDRAEMRQSIAEHGYWQVQNLSELANSITRLPVGV